jgi:hypothetical protein
MVLHTHNLLVIRYQMTSGECFLTKILHSVEQIRWLR